MNDMLLSPLQPPGAGARPPAAALAGRYHPLALLALSLPLAAGAAVKDSADFNLKFEMDSVPSAVYSANKGWSSDGDVLTFNNAANGDGAFGWSSQLANAQGYTIEMRYQITQPNTPGTTSQRKYVFQFQGADGAGTLALHTLQVGVPLADSQLGIYSSGGNLGQAISAGEWHTLRVVGLAKTNLMQVWSDGVEITGFDWQSANNTVNRAWCGDLGVSVTDGSYKVDYFRVDNTGPYAPPALAVPVATQSPASVTNVLGARIVLSGKFSGIVNGMQWYKDNVAVPGADGSIYVIDPATQSDSGSYVLRATNVLGAAETTPAYVQVLTADTTAPMVQSVKPVFTLQNVRLAFTRPILAETLTNLANYSFQGNALPVLGATRINQYAVDLQTGFQTPGASYTLVINNVRDSLSNPIASGTTTNFTTPMLIPCLRYDAGTSSSQPGGPPDPVAAAGGFWQQTTNLNNGMSTNAIVDDLGTGLNAWQITDMNVLSSSGVLDYRIPIDQASDNLARSNGWRLLTRCRLAENFSATTTDQLVVYCDTGLGLRYGMFFAMDSMANTFTVSLLGGASYTMPLDASVYHYHALAYDPATAKVAYYYDGQPIDTNYAGQAASGYNGVAFGSAAAASSGQMNYNLVQFDVLGGTRPVILANPKSTTNGVGQKVTFTASFSPFVGAFQWFSNSVVIPGATNTSYTTDFITVGYNGSQYTCRALHALGNVETAPATLTVTSDTTAPAIAAVKPSLLLTRLTITFTEPVQESSATNLANYSWLNPGVTNLSTRMIDPLKVELHCTPLSMGSNYTVRVSNVRDTSNLAIAANTPASFTAPWLETVVRYYAGTTAEAPSGPADPATAAGGGWTVRLDQDNDLSASAVTDDLGSGLNAWEVRDASVQANHFAAYTYPLATNVHQYLAQNGWVLSVRSRFVEDFGTPYTLYAGYADPQLNRSLVFFDMNPAGELTADLSVGGSFTTYTLTSGGQGTMDYHLHQVAFDPASTNSLYVCDDQLVAGTWKPSYNAGSTPGVTWGSGSSANMGTVHFNLIELKTLAAPFVAIGTEGQNLKVQFRGVLEMADQLASPTVWSPVATNFLGGTNGTFSVPLGSGPQQFFRARLQP